MDFIFYILILTYLGCRFKSFFIPKQMLSNIILVDILIRLLYIYFNSFEYILLNEILLNNILKKMFKDEYYDGTASLEIQSPFLLSLIFFFLTFTFNLSKSLSIIQYILSIFAIISYAYYIQSRIYLLLNNMEKKRVETTCKKMSINSVYLIAFYFIIFYILKMCNLFIENKLYYSYILLGGDIFKEVSKFLLFGSMILLIKSFNRLTKEDDEEENVKIYN